MQYILDVTRFVSRVGSGFDTGIDRVERATIIDTLARRKTPFFLCKTGKKYSLFDKAGMQKILSCEAAKNWPAAKTIDRLRLKLTQQQQRVRSVVNSVALTTVSIDKLTASLNALLSNNFMYLNFGHSNISNDLFSTLKAADCKNIVVLIHDLIPLDYPEYCRSDSAEKYKRKIEAVSAFADHVICNSKYTKQRLKFYCKKFGRVPNIGVSYFGNSIVDHDLITPLAINENLNFIILGTLEPRKNLGVLLNAWDQLALEIPSEFMPNLLIVGRRGWESDAFFQNLENHSLYGKRIFEFNSLDDRSVIAALKGSRALLFPSFVEGYGLPVQEAISLGVPVICSDIPVFRELFVNYVRLIKPDNPKQWADVIKEYLENMEIGYEANHIQSYSLSWDEFFEKLYITIEKGT